MYRRKQPTRTQDKLNVERWWPVPAFFIRNKKKGKWFLLPALLYCAFVASENASARQIQMIAVAILCLAKGTLLLSSTCFLPCTLSILFFPLSCKSLTETSAKQRWGTSYPFSHHIVSSIYDLHTVHIVWTLLDTGPTACVRVCMRLFIYKHRSWLSYKSTLCLLNISTYPNRHNSTKKENAAVFTVSSVLYILYNNT